LKKLGFLRATVSLSRTKEGSTMVAMASTDEATAKAPMGTKRRTRDVGKSSAHMVLRRRPVTFPTLDTIESLAKALAQFDFDSVSIMRRLRGVADATETKEIMEYLEMVPAVVLSKKKETRAIDIRA
jgi:hypothetical protein